MKRSFILAFVLFCAIKVDAKANAGFGLDAFNRAVSAATRGTVVFSPFSFEIDGVVFSEAVDPLSRAKLAETMGVLNGLEYVYRPLYDALTTGNTNISFLTARGFCLPDDRKANPSYRQWMQRTFSAEAFSYSYITGAGCWFRSRLDGEMEDFTLQSDVASDSFYSYYDLVFAKFPWKDPFPTNNTRSIKFHIDSNYVTNVQALCDLRIGDIWERKNYSALKLPMSDDAYFFALLPNQNFQIRELRDELSSSKLADFICGFKSITELGIFHGPIATVIPKIDVISETDLKLPFEYFRFPTYDMERMQKGIKPRFLRQRVRFKLDERGGGNCFITEKSARDIVRLTEDTKRFALNKPFLFFIYHEKTETIPIVGQFTGR